MPHADKADNERVTLLGPRSEFMGSLSTSEQLVILGRLEGRRVHSPHITIGPAAQVRAEIHAGQIRIEGTVVGDVYAQVAVVVQSSASVQGAIHSPRVTIQEGAVVNGVVDETTPVQESKAEQRGTAPRSTRPRAAQAR